MSSHSTSSLNYADRLHALYPPGLELLQVQIFFRHGERTPTTARFQNLGLSPFWKQCSIFNGFKTSVLSNSAQNTWDGVTWVRTLETFAGNDGPRIASATDGQINGLCGPGQLTDIGRNTMLQLGQHLRRIYVDRLGLLPSILDSPNSIYLRSTSYQRAIDSLHQAFNGLYPPDTVSKGIKPTFVTRLPKDETLLPNEDHCERFIQLMRAFSKRTAQRYNNTKDVAYLNASLQKFMPYQRPIAVDSKPSIAGILDTVSAVRAASDATLSLPDEFHEANVRSLLDKVAFEEEYAGFAESAEYRRLASGALLGDVVERAVARVQGSSQLSNRAASTDLRLVLAAGHDTTVMGILASLGSIPKGSPQWPPFGANLAIEIFRSEASSRKDVPSIGRKRMKDLQPGQREALAGHYVRLIYNGEPVVIPTCAKNGNHLRGREDFCALTCFKSLADLMTPHDWRKSCVENLGSRAIPDVQEPPGLQEQELISEGASLADG